MIAMRNILTKLCIFLFFLGITVAVFAQPAGISVQPGDFYRDESDLTARMHPVRNDNAQNCALLKIITTEKDFVFEPDALGMCRDVECKTAEVWLWLAPGSRRLTIKHPQLGQLRNYEYPLAIEPSTVYVMKLTTGKVTTIVNKANRENWLALSINPPEAVVKIDGEIVVVENGEFKKIYPVGQHTYEAFCDLYYPQQGTFTIKPTGTTGLALDLKPNHGFVSITSSPSGATVYINGRQVGKTPYLSDKLAVGSYSVQLAKDMYQSASETVIVSDNNTTPLNVTLNANFAEPTFTVADKDAEIWINGEKKGTGSWTGRLAAGAYKVEVRKYSHYTVTQSVEFENGDNPQITLDVPMPIYGRLDVNTTPMDAEVLVDGKKVGRSPMLISDILLGSHQITLLKRGYESVEKSVNIEPSKTAELSVTLRKSKEEDYGYTNNSSVGKQRQVSTFDFPKQWWVAYNMGVRLFPEAGYLNYGLSVMQMARWGWYVNAMSNFMMPATALPDGINEEELTDAGFSRFSLTAGVVFGTCQVLSLRLGVGVGYGARLYYYLGQYNYDRYADPIKKALGADVDLGLLWHIKNFMIITELNTTNFKTVELRLGLGYGLGRKR